jgi:hypothetical protein
MSVFDSILGRVGAGAAEKLDPTIQKGMHDLGAQVAATIREPEVMKNLGEGFGKAVTGQVLANPEQAGAVAKAVTGGIVDAIRERMPDVFAAIPEILMNALSGPNSVLGRGGVTPDDAASIIKQGYENLQNGAASGSLPRFDVKNIAENLKQIVGLMLPEGALPDEDRLKVLERAAGQTLQSVVGAGPDIAGNTAKFLTQLLPP